MMIRKKIGEISHTLELRGARRIKEECFADMGTAANQPRPKASHKLEVEDHLSDKSYD